MGQGGGQRESQPEVSTVGNRNAHSNQNRVDEKTEIKIKEQNKIMNTRKQTKRKILKQTETRQSRDVGSGQ